MSVNFKEIRLEQRKIESSTSNLSHFFETSIFLTAPWLVPSNLELISDDKQIEIDNEPQEIEPEAENQTTFLKEEVVDQQNSIIKEDEDKPLVAGESIKVEMPFPAQSEKGLKILFLGDTVDGGLSYHADNSDMLGRMILAMNLEEGDFARSPGDEDVFETIAKLKPQVIVSLGAKATNLLLGKKEKLTSVHGKFFSNTLEFGSGEKIDISFIPVFHPDYLEINPSMKRSAWTDLQKVQNFLKS